MQYDLCEGIHGNQGCQEIKNLAMPSEHVDYIGNATQPQNNAYNNKYNLGWKNHPKFS